PLPEVKKGEVRIKIYASGFNPIDVKTRMGGKGGETPVILGADCSGVVDAVGKDVSEFALGDEVYAMSFGQGSNGSYAEYLSVPEQFVAKKPKRLGFAQAAAIPLAAMTAYRAVIASSSLKRGDRVLIAGMGGGVGSLAVQMIQQMGPAHIITVAGSEESARFLNEKFGIALEHILIYKGLSLEQMREKLIAMNEGELFNATYDCVGGEMKRLCLELTGFSGHFASIVPEAKPFDFPVWEGGRSLCIARNMSLHLILVGAESHGGPQGSWSIYRKHLSAVTQMIEEGSLIPQQTTIVGPLSVQTVVEAHRLIEEGRVKGKLIMSERG
ncbi:MAG: NADP-dependent oxidoreductase, partial [Chlamydiota bacterium]